MTPTDQLHDDADELLHWLNTHSVRLSDGVPATLLHQMWSRSDRDDARLKAALEWLFAEQLVSLTQGLQPPHLRFTPKGYTRLLQAMDEARLQARSAAAADDARPTRQPKGNAVLPTPAPLHPPAAAATANATAATSTTPAAAPAVIAEAAAQAPSLASMVAPGRFLEPGKAPTEIGLRNQILFIFRDINLQAGQQLIAMTLARYWQEMGLRGADLRVGIDVLMRDGLLKHAMKRYENYWQLTEAGAAYTYGPVTPAALLALAEPMKRVEDGIRPSTLMRASHKLFGNSGEPLPFARLVATFNGSRDALLHGLDLLWKQELIRVQPGNDPGAPMVALTESGKAARFGLFG